MSEDTDTTTPDVEPASEKEQQVVQTLLLLGEDARAKVMAGIKPEHRERINQLVMASGGEMTMSMDERRRLVRETSARMYASKVRAADEAATELGAGGAPRMAVAPPELPGAVHPLEALRTTHPAALARAMQGERAEAWALVLDRLEPNAQAALRMYLDEDARVAIEQARTHQLHLAPAVRATIERAIAQTIVPAALREHARLLTSSATPMQTNYA